jgi:hypothetical protein
MELKIERFPGRRSASLIDGIMLFKLSVMPLIAASGKPTVSVYPEWGRAAF